MNDSPRHSSADYPAVEFHSSARVRERAQSLAILGAIGCFWVFVIALELTVQSLGAVQFSH